MTGDGYNILWNLTNDDGYRVDPDLYRVIFDTDSYNHHGDILVIE